MSHHQKPPYRELDQRTADGLAVTLEWNLATAALRVVVGDRESAAFTFTVRAEDASDAFFRPFVYAGRTVCEVAWCRVPQVRNARYISSPTTDRRSITVCADC